MTLDEARHALLEAAYPLSRDTAVDVTLVRALCEAATAYAAARTSSAPSRPAVASGVTFPNYGNAKNQPVAGASQRDLEFYKRGCERTLADASKSRWHEKEAALLEAINEELGRQ